MQAYTFILYEYVRSGIAGSCDKHMFNFLRNGQVVFKMAMPFTMQGWVGIPAELHPCQNSVLSYFKI